MEALEQGPRPVVALRIELVERVAVAPQEIGQPKHVRIGLVANDDGAGAGLDQTDPAQDQRAHDPLAQVGLCNQQGAHAIGRNRDQLHVGQRGRVDQVRTARKLRQLAHEIAALVSDDVGALATVVLGDLDLARQHQLEADTLVAEVRHRLSCSVRTAFAETRDANQLRVRKAREHLVPAPRNQFGAELAHPTGMGSATRGAAASAAVPTCSPRTKERTSWLISSGWVVMQPCGKLV